MKYNDFIQRLSSAQKFHTQTKTPTLAEKSLAKAGIPPDAPYYRGALHQIEQALVSRKSTSEAFWKSYQLSLCAHLEQLEHTGKEVEKDMIQMSIRTVQAILYAFI